MAKLRSGILGKTSGSVANIVTSSWKGINYARERVIPANPKSAGQSRVRGTMTNIVLIGRAVKTTFIDTYWENIVKGTPNSGWAKYVGVNQKAIQKDEDYENIKLATGDLEAVTGLSSSLNAGTNSCNFDWESSVVSNGSSNDVVYLHCYVPERNFVYTQVSSYTRADGTGGVAIPDVAGLTGDVYAFITLKKANGSLFSTTQGSIAS